MHVAFRMKLRSNALWVAVLAISFLHVADSRLRRKKVKKLRTSTVAPIVVEEIRTVVNSSDAPTKINLDDQVPSEETNGNYAKKGKRKRRIDGDEEDYENYVNYGGALESDYETIRGKQLPADICPKHI